MRKMWQAISKSRNLKQHWMSILIVLFDVKSECSIYFFNPFGRGCGDTIVSVFGDDEIDANDT